MAYDQFHQINATSQMIEVALRSATTGQLLTGVAFGSVTAKYVREGSNTQVTVSVVTATQGTFTSGGWVETGIAGVYQFGIPDAALAAGAKAVTLVFSASGAIDVVKRVLLVVEDLREVLVSSRLAPATAGRTLAVAATGEAAANVTYWSGDAVAGAPALEATAQAILEDTGTTLPGLIAAIAQTVSATTDSTTPGSIVRRRGDSWSIALTLGAITGYTSLWFTIKSSRDDLDSAAIVQIKLNSPSATDGLLYVNGAAASNALLGSITVSDATTGAIIVAVDETITDDLSPGTYYYDAQALITGAVTTPDSGMFTITADVTRSVT